MYRVLLVDDEPLALEGLALLIDWVSEGFIVVGQCSSGLEALGAMEEAMPDLIVTDLYMPGMDGVELMQAVREAGYSGAFVIASAYQDFHKAQQSLRYGALSYLLKPVDDEEAARTLRSVREALSVRETAAQRWQREIAGDSPDDEPERVRSMSEQMRGYVAAHYMENISLQTIADALGHNAAYLGRLFQKQMGMGFRDFLNVYRLEEAARRIQSSHLPLYQIAEAVGYTKYSYFLMKFKQRFGMMPEQYRKNAPNPSP